jgi:hypothetical protein
VQKPVCKKTKRYFHTMFHPAFSAGWTCGVLPALHTSMMGTTNPRKKTWFLGMVGISIPS